MSVKEASDLAIADNNSVVVVELAVLVVTVDTESLVVTAIMGSLFRKAGNNEKRHEKGQLRISISWRMEHHK